MDIWLNELKSISIETINLLTSLELGKNSCIIFNIDNTLIHEDGQLLTDIVNIYNYALQLDIKIFIITNRNGSSQEIIDTTLLELKNNNLNSYEAIYFKKYENRNDSSFKINSRKNIISKGYNIILCIGSNDTDIYGEFTGIPVKIPIYIKNILEVIKEE